MLHLAAGCGNEKAGLFLVNNGANCSAANNKVNFHKHCISVFTVCVMRISTHSSEMHGYIQKKFSLNYILTKTGPHRY